MNPAELAYFARASMQLMRVMAGRGCCCASRRALPHATVADADHDGGGLDHTARVLAPHRRCLSGFPCGRTESDAVGQALAMVAQLGANKRGGGRDSEREEFLDALAAQMRETVSAEPRSVAVSLATRLADHGDLIRAMLPEVHGKPDRRRRLFCSKSAALLLPPREFEGALHWYYGSSIRKLSRLRRQSNAQR
eukprot:SAG11_NODE_1920_length_4069_cov_3.001511_6_plen_194_part_00